MFYIQYDEQGNISATVNTDIGAPAAPRQLAFDTWQDTTGLMVDPVALTLIPDPNYDISE